MPNGIQTLCWDCMRSVKRQCAWARKSKPIEGWKAVKSKDGYAVLACPEFVRDSWGFGLYRTEEEFLKKTQKKTTKENVK